MPEYAEDARFNVPYHKPETGPMDRFAEIKPADAWGKTLTDGYVTVSPGIVQKEFEIVLGDGELINEVMYGLITKAEQIPSAIPLFWREQGAVNGHPMVLVQGHPHRVARFEELYNLSQEPTRNGWIHWLNESANGNPDEYQRVLWLLWDGDRSKLTTQSGEKVRCQRAGCGRADSPRWAVAYNVECLGAHAPMPGYEVKLLCQSCATPDCDTAVFIEEEA